MNKNNYSSLERKPTISACLIIKDAEKTLDRALSSVSFCDEIIILDSGSSDKSIEIAKKYTKNIFFNTDWQGFGKQRQIAQNYASSDWILFIDADEYLSDSLIKNIKEVVKDDKDKNTCYIINRLSTAFGKDIKNSGWYPDFLIRLYPKNLTKYSDDLVHETVRCPHGSHTKKLEGILRHETYESLEHYLKKVIPYTHAWAKQRVNKKKSSLLKASKHAIFAFIRQYILKRGFLDGRIGFLLAALTSFSTFIKYVDLWLLNKNKQQ